jgi:NAD-dependent dihydropyrimidine dehydrogenase PreA subunit
MRPLLYLKDVVTLAFDAGQCTGCGMCLAVCPREVFRSSNGKVEVALRDACIECGACRRNCPHGALSVRSGVGCASAVINDMFGRKRACCGIGGDGCPSR